MSQTREIEGWTLHAHEEATSTNELSRNMPAWSAIRADVQTQGRGRHHRAWISSKGGLWLSCVVPAPPPYQKWETLPLAAGAAIIEVLQKFGVGNTVRQERTIAEIRKALSASQALKPKRNIDSDQTAVLPGPRKPSEIVKDSIRLRWPNDIMVGNKKLCGLLIERHNAETAVIGLGINVTNRPDLDDPTLESIAVSLVQLIPVVPTIDELTTKILSAIRTMHGQMDTIGWNHYREFLNASWDTSLAVECQLDSGSLRGTFKGIDPHGNLLLLDGSGELHALNPLKVVLFREV